MRRLILTLGSVFFSANKYHWYHAPISGKVVSLKTVHGIIYAIDKINQNVYNDLKPYNTEAEKLDKWIKYGARGLTFTQAYLAHVATRCIIEIENETVSF